MSPPAARSLYLDVEREAVYSLFHDSGGRTGKAAVLLCPPFGWDDMCSYRARHDWACQLAANGHPALRIDLPGSGDSASSPRDPARLKAWTRAIGEAARWLKLTTGAPRVVAVGIGLGGMLATLAAAADAPVDDLVLWAVPARGRALVRELRAFERLGAAMATGPGELPHPPLPDGALAANGYLLSAESVASLESVDLAGTPLPDGEHRRVLLLGRNGPTADEALETALRTAGVQVSNASGSGYDLMMLEPQDAQSPLEVFQTVLAWLAEPGASSARERAQPLDPAEPVATAQTLTLDVAGTSMRETPLLLDQPEGCLRAILSEPAGSRREMCAVLLNAGPQRRTGPNRMWVEIARRWASRGVPTLRIDLAGIGDSDGDTSRFEDVAWLYVPEYIRQVQATLDMLESRGLPGRFFVVGLCAGAYWSFHTALADSRIAAVCLLNPRSLVWDEWTHARRRTRDMRELLFQAATWRKIVRGEITLHRHLQTARGLWNHAKGAPGRAWLRLTGGRSAAEPAENPLDSMFDALRKRDQRALVLFTGSEPLHEDFHREGRLDRLDRWSNLRLAIHGTSADTHTLAPIWLQHEIHELVDSALEQELERIEAPAAQSPSAPAGQP